MPSFALHTEKNQTIPSQFLEGFPIHGWHFAKVPRSCLVPQIETKNEGLEVINELHKRALSDSYFFHLVAGFDNLM